MSEVFISYSRADRARAEQLAQALKARGLDVWWDPDLIPGEQYSKTIARVLDEAKAVVVLWSKESVASNWVQDEASVGRDRNKLVPVRIEPVDAPLGFRQVEAEDLSRWPDPESGPAFERVLMAIERLRGADQSAGQARLRAASRKRAFNRLGIAAGVLVALGLGAVAVRQVVTDTPVIDGPGGGGEDDDIPTSTTDSPGADELYGFARAELSTFTPTELIQVALQRTSLEAIEAGAEAGDPLGRTLLCLANAYGEGLPQRDPQAARPLCEQAATAGQGLAQFQLSLFARAGEAGYSGDAAEADRLLARASDAGDPRAQTERARALLATRLDDAAAAQLARAAVDQGYPPAAILYGWMHENGRGAVQDTAMAFQLYQRAGEGGSAEGLRRTAMMLEDGVGVPQDYAQARARYAVASQLGDGESSFRLARLHEMGRGADADAEAALRYYRLAAQQGYAQAAAEVTRLETAQQ